MNITDDFGSRDWQRLVDSIEENQCVLVLGPDAVTDDSGYPLTQLLANILLEDSGMDSQNIERAQASGVIELSLAAQLFMSSGRNNATHLKREVKRFYDRYTDHQTDLLDNLSSVPFTIVLQTTQDDVFERALLSHGKQPLVDGYNIVNPAAYKSAENYEKAQLSNPNQDYQDPEKPLLYHLFGSRTLNNKMVLSEYELLLFAENIFSGSTSLPPSVSSVLKSEMTTYLFVGFGFQRWIGRILLHVLRPEIFRHGFRSGSVALEAPSVYAREDWQEYSVFFEKGYAINFVRQDWNNFGIALREKLNKSTAPVVPGRKVFLSYADEDHQIVDKIESKLNVSGLPVWPDKSHLRGGSNWKRQISNVYKNQVFFVVVVHSDNFNSESSSFLIDEVNQAVAIQQNGESPGLIIATVYLDDSRLKDFTDDELNVVHCEHDEIPNKIRDKVMMAWEGMGDATA